ncbi:MAG: DUF92 domain-containing protein [Candidatus Omnitrophica bacterium]|nr:DUF92 domain-containing protein [Candidatus Omnitrophota bacterium]
MKRDDKRQWVHIGALLFAFNVRFLSAPWAFLLAAAAFIHNIFLLPKYAPRLFRGRERLTQGIAVYPLMVALLILIFPNDLNLACAVWAILACGDGFSNLIGKRMPLVKIPWNPNKSLGGSVAFLLTATAGAFLLLAWTGPIPSFRHLLMAAAAASFMAAVYETLPLPWDDNLVVTLIGAVFIALFWKIDLHPDSTVIRASWWGICLLINAGAGGAAWMLGFVSSSGVTGGLVIGTIILAMGGWELYVLLWLFFILASLATRLGYHIKVRMGVAQEEGGRRGSKHAVANCLMAALAIVAIGSTDGMDMIMAVFFCGALAAALGDTLSSELGQLFGRSPFMPTTFRKVPAGTVGAISIEGTLYGMMGVILFAAVAYFLEAISGNLAPAVMIGGWIGFYAESFIAAYWMDEGVEINNEWMNLLNTFIGGSMAIITGVVTLGFS